MKVSKMTFTGNRDNRKFNRVRGGYCVVAKTNRVAKVISYRKLSSGLISLSCLVDNGKGNEHNWQMVRNVLPAKTIGVVSKNDAFLFSKALEAAYARHAGQMTKAENCGSSKGSCGTCHSCQSVKK